MAAGRYIHLLVHLCWVCGAALAQQCEVASLPAACYPPTEPNIVSGLKSIASNTCGLDGPERVCYQVGAGGSVAGTCDYCDSSVPELAHPPEFITDPHSPSGNLTFWQSQNHSVVQYPNTVAITFPLNKTFDVIRIAITFQSSRPESYAIYKSVDYGASFTPFQYYSLSCEATYGVEEGTTVTVGEEAVALCTSSEARMTPLSGGEAVFLPLMHRPSAESFLNNEQLQDWVRATHLQLRLRRLNTFGDAVLTSDPEVLDSYYYAISNVEVTGQCFCNGHAASCSENGAGDLVCDCQHNTAGPDCSECLAFYQDIPWSPATSSRPATCVACNCNNHSSTCRFDEARYVASGMVSGGVCEGCRDNTEGVQCETCRLGYYPNPDLDVPFTSPEACMACECDPLGTVGGESSCQQAPPISPAFSLTNGQCPCKTNVEGRRCSVCKDGFHTLDIDDPDGCLPCSCVAAGTANSSALCDKHSGQCDCLPTVGGRDCDTCVPGYFNYDPLDNPPCLKCDCFVGGSVSNVCNTATGDCECRSNIGGVVTNLLGVGRDVVVCDSALSGFFCHGLALVSEAEGEELAGRDIVQGSSTELFTGSGFVQLPANKSLTITNISVPFCGEYDLFLKHAPPGGPGNRVKIVIRNTTPLVLSPEAPPPCPPLVKEVVELSLSLGSFTQLPLSACLLAEGSYYSAVVTSHSGPVLVDALLATPSLGAAAGQLEVFADEEVLQRYRDEECILEHVRVVGVSPPSDDLFCERVTCSASYQLFNGALACNCDGVGSTSDQCSSYRGQCGCRPGFMGRQCDLCTPGNSGPECQPCSCDPIGSLSTSCDRLGQCVCKPGVGGLTCNTCLAGYFNQSDRGCEKCGCDEVGSEGVACDEEGACLCREGVRGRRCDECDVGYFNLTERGCSLCPCPSAELGSQFATSCVEVTGGEVRCDGCREGHAGDHCELCAEGYVGDPTGDITGSLLPCLLCECNGNVDSLTAADPCNLATGVCVGCLGNTAGDHCERCASGYQGDAITAKNCTVCPEDHYWLSNATCQPCGCHSTGSVQGECEDVTGRCGCVEDVTGDKCDVCREGYHLIDQGCVACPACYNQVALEFNKTLTLFSNLLSELNTSMATNGGLPADLLAEIRDYQVILEELLEWARNLTNREKDLKVGVALVTSDADELEDMIGRLAENVSLAEEGLARLIAQSGPASRLLLQLQTMLGAVEQAVRVELRASLSQIQDQLLALQTQFDSLLSLSALANETSATQYELAVSLLSEAMKTSAMAQRALRLLFDAIALQNETTAAIETLVETQLPLDSILQSAVAALREAAVSVPLALSQAREILNRVRNISAATYDSTVLEARLQNLQTQTENLVSNTVSVSTELEQAEDEVEGVSERASLLIMESSRLNILAAELLGRAHAAFSFANRTVEDGNEFVAMVEQLLLELLQRLANSQGFVSGLQEVIQNVMLAEELVGGAEGEGERKREEVREAARSVEQAVLAMEDASRIIAQALAAALSVNRGAGGALSNATLLSSETEDLAAGVSASEERLVELEGMTTNNAGFISMATETAQTAISDAGRLQVDIQQLLLVLEELHVELNSTELLPGDRLSEVGSMVTQLESQADANQITINALQNQVGELEASAVELRERHVSLQQHRDLLQTILNNIQQLDCRNQFQSI